MSCTNTTYAAYYFHWCLSDSDCQENLHLFEDDEWQFTQMLDNELLGPMHLDGNSTCDPVAEPFWQALLRTINLCYPNHYRDVDGTCILRPGRSEDPDVEFSTTLSGSLPLLVDLILLAAFIWLAVNVLGMWYVVRDTIFKRYHTVSQMPASTTPPHEKQQQQQQSQRLTSVNGVMKF